MDNKYILILVTAILVIIALYIAFTSASQKPVAENTTVQNDLLLKGLGFGEGQANYIYAYNDISDGYKNTYFITKSSTGSSVQVQDPLSTKTIYFLANDTILCVRYPVNETCSSVQNNSDVANYLEFIQTKLLNDTLISKNKDDIAYLIANNYLTFDPDVVNSSINGDPCSRVSYTIDYTSATINDAYRFGIGPDTPKVFLFSMCIGSDGTLFERDFNYTYNNTQHYETYSLISWKPGMAGQFMPPENLTDGAVDLLSAERTQQIQLANCFVGSQGDDRDRCVAGMALQLERQDLCDIAGQRKDRCLVSLVPLLKDTALCTEVGSQFFKDDCYIELAGAYKNSTYCAEVQNQSKMQQCNDAATPFPQQPSAPPTPVGNTSANATNATSASNSTNASSFDVLAYMNAVDKGNGTGANSTNQS